MRYWKILNKDGFHNCFKYKYGWNEDMSFFNLSDREYVKYKLYFASSKNILEYLGHGPIIREVLDWDKENCEELENKIRSKKIKLGRKRKMTVNWLKELIKDGADVHAWDEAAFRYAAEEGHLEIIEFLYEEGANIHVLDDWAFIHAANNNHLDIAEFLYNKGADIHADDDWAFIWAKKKGHTEIIAFLEKAMKAEKKI